MTLVLEAHRSRSVMSGVTAQLSEKGMPENSTGLAVMVVEVQAQVVTSISILFGKLPDSARVISENGHQRIHQCIF